MERPILFSTPMIQAILDVRKTQTRRLMKIQPEYSEGMGKWVLYPEQHPTVYADLINANKYCLYGEPGDILWVRETFYAWGHWTLVTTHKTNSVKKEWHFNDLTLSEGKIYHYEDNPPENIIKGRFGLGWHKRPSIFMPKEACRIKLLIKDIRVERLQDISEEDAKVEGCEKAIKWIHTGKIEVIDTSHVFYHHSTYKDGYKMLWEAINGKDSWGKNPWVWVIEFERYR